MLTGTGDAACVPRSAFAWLDYFFFGAAFFAAFFAAFLVAICLFSLLIKHRCRNTLRCS